MAHGKISRGYGRQRGFMLQCLHLQIQGRASCAVTGSQSISCGFYVLLFGMCFDSVGADSFSASAPSCEGEGVLSGAASLHARRRIPPAEQAYAPKAMNHGETVLVPCQAMRRSPSRPGRGLGFAALPGDSFSVHGASVRRADSPACFHEVTSNTVIIGYIHRQDGEKA